MTDNKPKQDSSTQVNLWWKGKRKVVGFRCNAQLWETFKQLALAEGTSTCHLLESIVAGVLTATKTPVNTRQTIEIRELHVERVGGRVRRYAREVEGGDFPVGEDGRVLPRCAFDVCGVPGVIRMEKKGVGHCFVCPSHAHVQERRGWSRV